MINVAEQLADIFGCSPEEIIRQTTANARQLFSIEK
jgi:Tat protein secretion system quality control protein TatD with DNase activity